MAQEQQDNLAIIREVLTPPSVLEDIADETIAQWSQPYEVALKGAYLRLRGILTDQSETFIKAVWLYFQRDPKLQTCSDESIQAAVIRVAQSGLDITREGEVWLIPMHNTKKWKEPHPKNPSNMVEKQAKVWECEFWIGYIGRLRLARNAPGVTDADFDIVRVNDEYRFHNKFTMPDHSYAQRGTPRGDIDYVYAWIRFTSGALKVFQLHVDDAKAHRDQYSRGASRYDSPWQEKKNNKEQRGFQYMVAKTLCNQAFHPRNMDFGSTINNMLLAQESREAEFTQPANGFTRESQPSTREPEDMQTNTAHLFGDEDKGTDINALRDILMELRMLITTEERKHDLTMAMRRAYLDRAYGSENLTDRDEEELREILDLVRTFKDKAYQLLEGDEPPASDNPSDVMIDQPTLLDTTEAEQRTEGHW